MFFLNCHQLSDSVKMFDRKRKQILNSIKTKSQTTVVEKFWLNQVKYVIIGMIIRVKQIEVLFSKEKAKKKKNNG